MPRLRVFTKELTASPTRFTLTSRLIVDVSYTVRNSLPGDKSTLVASLDRE
jgi:hypothetical protein